MRGNEDSDPFRMSELMDSDEQVPDGVGCTEIWEHMSEVRESDDDTAEGECREDDTTDMTAYVVDEETGEVPGVDLDDGEPTTDYGETIVPGERVELILEDEDHVENVETMSVEESSVGLIDPEDLDYDDELDRNEFMYEGVDTTYEGSFEIEFEPNPEDIVDALRLMYFLSLTDQ